jgi:hypothetical protein
MANQVKILLYIYGLFDKIIVYVKDKRSNISILISTLTNVVTYYPFHEKDQLLDQLSSPFVGSCFGHAMPKAYQYTFNDSKVCVGFSKVSLKNVQVLLYKTIIWIKYLGRGNKSGRIFALFQGCQQ